MTEPGKEKHYRDMSSEERLAVFDALVAEEKRRHGDNTSHLRAALVIGVRHCVHPFAYELGRELMRRAAAACGDTTDAEGVWVPCWGELWLKRALSEPSLPEGNHHAADGTVLHPLSACRPGVCWTDEVAR